MKSLVQTFAIADCARPPCLARMAGVVPGGLAWRAGIADMGYEMGDVRFGMCDIQLHILDCRLMI